MGLFCCYFSSQVQQDQGNKTMVCDIEMLLLNEGTLLLDEEVRLVEEEARLPLPNALLEGLAEAGFALGKL